MARANNPSVRDFARDLCRAQQLGIKRWNQFGGPDKVSLDLFHYEMKPLFAPRRKPLDQLQTYFTQLDRELGRSPQLRVQPILPNEPMARSAAEEANIEDFLNLEMLATDLEMFELYLRAHRHQLTLGRFPASPADLTGEIASDTLLDPWGRAYRWRRKKSDLIVYSMGPDGKDDGGSAVPSGILQDASRGDLVLRGVRTCGRWLDRGLADE